MSRRWPTQRLGELVDKVGSGATPKGGEAAYQSTGIPLIRSMNVVFFAFKTQGLAHISEEQAAALDGATVAAGDVLLNITGASIGRVTVAPDHVAGARVNQHVCIIRPNGALNARFLNAYLSSPAMQGQIWADNYGVTRQALTKQQILQFEVPVPPLAEQQRIADKLDTVLARVDACRNRLARVAPLLKRFRRSVLAAATSGRLTEDWRGSEASDWLTARADEVCAKVQSGGTPKAGFSESGVPFLKVYNIVNQQIAFDYRPQFVHPAVHAGELGKSRALPGDVLMNIVGPPLGKVAVLTGAAAEWNINQAITLFRPGDRISSGWLYVVLCEGSAVRSVLDRTKGSVGQVNISLSQCRAFEFPVPTIEEQAEIVRRVETLVAFGDRLEARLAQAQTAVDRLIPSLLAKAFRGELVPQDPADEPATELLKRLAAHREAATRPRRKRATA